jgi:hypothetical protein
LQHPGESKDMPPGMSSPTGLFGECIDVLCGCEDHRFKGDRKRPAMVYWRHESLRKFADLHEVVRCAA